MIISARRVGSSVSEMSGLLGLSHTTHLRFTENDVNISQQQPVGENSSFMRGQRRTSRIAEAKGWATNRQITEQYNSGVQNSMLERLVMDGLLQQTTTPGSTPLS